MMNVYRMSIFVSPRYFNSTGENFKFLPSIHISEKNLTRFHC